MALSWPISGTDVIKALKWDASRTSEVEDYAAAAVSRVEAEVGPWHGQQITHRTTLHGWRGALVLPWPIDPDSTPILTIDGTAAALADGDLNPDAGLIHGPFGPGRYVIVATARPAVTVPDDVVLAARYLGAFWAKQELVGNPARTTRGTEPDTDVMQGFAMPRRVSEMLRPYVRSEGFS